MAERLLEKLFAKPPQSHLACLGCGLDWMIKLWLCHLLIQPSRYIGVELTVALWWLCMFFSHSALLFDMLPATELIQAYEQDFFSVGSGGLWRRQLFKKCLLQWLSLLLIWPVMAIATGLSLQVLQLLALAWVLLSPGYYLLWLLVRVVLLGMNQGVLLATIVVLPWYIPSMLWIVTLVHAQQAQQDVLGLCACMALWGGLELLLLPRVIDAALQQAYQHRYIE